MDDLCLAMEKLSLSTSDKLFKRGTNSQYDRRTENRKGRKRARCWKCHKFGHIKKYCHSNKPMRESRKSNHPIRKKRKYERQRGGRNRKWKCQMDSPSDI